MIKNNFFAGVRIVLPFVLFFMILRWIFEVLSSGIESILPNSLIEELSLPDLVVKFLGILVVCILVWLVGLISSQPKVNELFSFLLKPIIYRIPLLDSLFKTINQMADTLQLIASFKKVVLVETFSGGYEPGFVTGINPEEFCEALENYDLVSVVIPFAPLTSFRVTLVEAKKLKEVKISVSKAITYIITFGIVGATKKFAKIVNESHSESEWDFFNFECIVFLFWNNIMHFQLLILSQTYYITRWKENL